jgi:hypothetical protein
MASQDIIEQRIREVLATETNAVALSQQLFDQQLGLFAHLATSEEQRRVLVRTELFREANRRLSELQRQEAAARARARVLHPEE